MTLDWLDTVSKALGKENATLPLLGHCPPLNLEQLQATLKQNPALADLSTSWGIWQAQEAPFQGCEGAFTLGLYGSTLQGKAWAFIPEPQIKALAKHYIQEAAEDPELLNSFVYFFLSQILKALQAQAPLQPFSFWGQIEAPPQEPAPKPLLTQEVQLQYATDAPSLTCRLVMNHEFCKSWREYWGKNPWRQIDLELAAKVELDVHLHAGHLELSPQMLAQLKEGDWLSLDQSGYANDGSLINVTLQTHGINFAKGQIQDHNLTLSEVENSELQALGL